MNKELNSIKISRLVSHFTNFVMLKKYARNGLDYIFKHIYKKFNLQSDLKILSY